MLFIEDMMRFGSKTGIYGRVNRSGLFSELTERLPSTLADNTH